MPTDQFDQFDQFDEFDEFDPATEPEVRAAIEEQISCLVRDAVAEEWVRPLDDVIGYVAEEMGVDDPEVFEALSVLVGERSRDDGVRRLGDRVVDVTRFAPMAQCTHRLTADEVEDDTIELGVDAPLLGALADVDGGLHRPDDAAPLHLHRRLEYSAERGVGPRVHRRLVGPAGWLADHAPGDLVVLHANDGYLTVDASAEVESASVVADRLRDRVTAAIVERNQGDGSPIGADDLLLTALVDGWWPTDEVLPPLGEVVEALGLEVRADLVGPPGCWEKFTKVTHAVGLLVRHGQHLDDKAAMSAVARFVKAFDDFCDELDAIEADPSDDPGRSPRPPDAALAVQVHRGRGAGAMCLHEELQRLDPAGERILAFLAAMPPPKGPAVAVRHTLEALGYELVGDPVAAERAVEAAVAADPRWFPALDAKLSYLEARGDLRATVNTMAVLREPDDPDLLRLRQRLALVQPAVGRNEPCPCGSGRKFKQCHQGRTELPVQERVGWLLERAANWVERYAELDVDAVTTAVAEHTPGDAREVLAAVQADMVLFELGGLARFLAARRHLLPADDVALLEAWVTGERTSLYRVAGIADDGTLTLVDVGPARREVVSGTATGTAVDGGSEATEAPEGEIFQVARSLAFSSTSVHGLVWCRLLPVGDGWVGSGVVLPTRLQQRAARLGALEDRRAFPVDGHPAARRTAVAAYLRRLMAGDGDGGLLAGDGSPWVHGTATWHVGDDRSAIAAVMDEAFAANPAEDADGLPDALAVAPSAGRPDEEWTSLDADGTVLATFRLAACLGPRLCPGASPDLLDAELEDRLDSDEFDEEAFTAYVAMLDSGDFGFDLTVFAHSIPRLRAAQEELQRLFPDAVQGRVDATPGRRYMAYQRIDEIMEALDTDRYDPSDDWEFDDADAGLHDLEHDPAFGAGGPKGAVLDEVMQQIPEELREQVLAEAIRAYEQQWLDLEVPALGGRTPREAAADPALRPDLLTLLAELTPSMEDGGGMSAARIRAALGLDPA